MKYRFNNDYCRGAHPEILKALSETNEEAFPGYGLDPMCEEAARLIQNAMGCNVPIHFLVGGTQVNSTAIVSVLRPYEEVVCADIGHIAVHETGAIEHGGHKVHTLPAKDGKITAEQVRQVAESYRISDLKEHITKPAMVYISYPTEYGTLYSRQELTEISDVCGEYGMVLYVDGARMAYGLGAPASDLTLHDFAELTDMFTIGGTKCGALFGEALVIPNRQLNDGFRACMKQNGGLLAKGWLLGLQYKTLFTEGLYMEIGRSSVEKAFTVRKAFEDAGIPVYLDSPTNQQFFVLTDAQVKELDQQFYTEFWERVDDNHQVIRLCTSWGTSEEAIQELCKAVKALS